MQTPLSTQGKGTGNKKERKKKKIWPTHRLSTKLTKCVLRYQNAAVSGRRREKKEGKKRRTREEVRIGKARDYLRYLFCWQWISVDINKMHTPPSPPLCPPRLEHTKKKSDVIRTPYVISLSIKNDLIQPSHSPNQKHITVCPWPDHGNSCLSICTLLLYSMHLKTTSTPPANSTKDFKSTVATIDQQQLTGSHNTEYIRSTEHT